MFNGTLEVGKEYEINNGEVHVCEVGACTGYALDIYWYDPDGRCADYTANHPLSVRGPAVGTLAELDVKPGDVVGWIFRDRTVRPHSVISVHVIKSGVYEGHAQAELSEYGGGVFDVEQFRIISRAEHAVEPVTDTVVTDTTVTATVVTYWHQHTGSFAVRRRYDATHSLTFDLTDGVPSNPRFEKLA